VDWLQPSSDAPLGTILIRSGEDTFVINLATTRIPSADVLRPMYGSASDEMRHELQSMALDMILTACFVALRSPGMRADVERFGFGDLIVALARRNEDHILRASQSIPRIMHLDSVDEQVVEHAVRTLLASERWRSATSGLPSDEDDAGIAETEDLDLNANQEPSQGLRGLLYYIAEDDARRKAYEHRGITCEECGQLPIQGVRWHCLNCPDFDLCQSCEAHTRHPKTHVFAKITIPLPVLSQPTREYRLWYPGDPRKIHAPLESNLKKRLCHDYKFEEPQMDALYDQFTCIANVPWDQDYNHVKSAIDRRAFNKSMTSERWHTGLTSNAVIDRMFAFYDTDNNGVIGFEEFVSGIAYLRGPKRFASLEKAIQGYDMDGDGYVDRSDFLRLFRAKFAIQKQLVTDAVQSQEVEQTSSNMETLRSSQPISSIFSEEAIPPGETRIPRGKHIDVHGDSIPTLNSRTILEDDSTFTKQRNIETEETLRSRLAVLHELVYGYGPDRQISQILEQTDSSEPEAPTSSGDSDRPYPVLDVQQVMEETKFEAQEAFAEDALWQITEDGFNTMLDPLFAMREREDERALKTRAERKTWRKEIDAEVASEREHRERLVIAAAEARMKAAAMGSDEATKQPPELPERRTFPGLDSAIVPTDWRSLERREAEIMDASLDDLLNAVGASVRDDEDDDAENERDGIPEPTDPSHADPSSRHSRDAYEPPGHDPPPADAGLSRGRLRELVCLDEVEREMMERGGAGRLSYLEVEQIAVAQSSAELRGLIKSWLEWASF
jgi:Ca2+-binding EF-hand superfamily protein